MNQGVLFEAEGDLEFVVDVFAGEVNADGSDGDWFLRCGKGKLDHEPK